MENTKIHYCYVRLKTRKLKNKKIRFPSLPIIYFRLKLVYTDVRM